MREPGLDPTWLYAWRREVSGHVAHLTESFEETYGYPAGDNTVTPADEATQAEATPPPGPLLSFYSTIDSVSLPDIGNGYFIHSPSTVIEHLAEYGHATLTNNDEPGVVFGSDGGGHLFALATDGSVHRSKAASWDAEFHAVATDLRDFLEQLRRAVERCAAKGCPGSL